MLLEQLERLNENLLNATSLHEKLEWLDRFPAVVEFFQKPHLIHPFLAGLTPECEVAMKQLIAIGQHCGLESCKIDRLRELLEQLLTIDRFYQELGGIVGYQLEVLKKIQGEPDLAFKEATFHSPQFCDISEESEDVKLSILAGLEALPFTAELYPLGGAADRLHLVDDGTGHDLPAAKMIFAGRSLLEGLIRDLEAREHLYYKLYGKKIQVPIAIMTSPEKDNHRLVIEICESNRWFGRDRELFKFFCQPLVPAVDQTGRWIWTAPGKPLLKPGGHGAIWKLARDGGIFEWLKAKNIQQLIVRQINNPLAGVDYGLLAFLGIGVKHQMAFGFISCPRLLKAAEGVNVLVERKKGDVALRVLTNIEYCDFARYGIEDVPCMPNDLYSRFTCNTNILFANLAAIEKAIEICPLPGLLINLKKASFFLENGEKKEEVMGRLESTMQNIADVFVEEHPISDCPKTDRTFVTFNHRRKTISTAKKAHSPGGSLRETPEQCFYDILQASRELLERHCSFEVAEKRSIEQMLQMGPECAFLYNPILGPLYTVMSQKIRGGKIEAGSELQLEVAELDLAGLRLEGSLRVLADVPTRGKCILRNVQVVNRGVDWGRSKPFWKYQLERFESMEIRLKGTCEFIAEDVSFVNDQKWVVEDGMRTIVGKDGTVKTEPLLEP